MSLRVYEPVGEETERKQRDMNNERKRPAGKGLNQEKRKDKTVKGNESEDPSLDSGDAFQKEHGMIS